jgi:hypothetical protein
MRHKQHEYAIHVLPDDEVIITLKYVTWDQMKVDKVCGTCSAHLIGEKCKQHFSQKIWREETTWEA